jgi:tripartite ATP-independent transporter DctM subunit
LKRALERFEDAFAALLLLALAALPVSSFLLRELSGTASALAIPLTQHLNLLLAFAGAALAAREQKLLRLATAEFQERLPFARWLVPGAALCSCLVTGLLARAAFELVRLERDSGTSVGALLPLWPLLLVMPLALLAIGARLIWTRTLPVPGRVGALFALAAGALLGDGPFLGHAAWPWVLLLVLAAVYGAPLHVPLAGCAMFLFLAGGTPSIAVPVEMLQLAVSPFLPAIPLFTLTGLLLTEGAARRLLAVFRALLGWMPGGTAVVCVLLCAFLSVFTGGSGVTILALGGLLLQALRADGYREQFSLGLLTGSASLGILLPPALPLILFGIAAQVPIEDLFRSGILPGIVLLVLVGLSAMRAGLRSGVARTSFRVGEAAHALWAAKFELLLPLVALGLILSGVATLLEAAALTAVYALVVEVFVKRELSLRSDLPRVLRECGALLGGVLIILCAAKGLSSYFVDAELPARLIELVRGSVSSPWVFLLYLNLFLLVVGCFLDIYSATFVVVPLILGLGRAYDIHPVHLGIIFIANLELGYLTPPVGLNLFLASYRFQRPLLVVARATLPLLLWLGLGVLLITYVPWLTTALLP